MVLTIWYSEPVDSSTQNPPKYFPQFRNLRQSIPFSMPSPPSSMDRKSEPISSIEAAVQAGLNAGLHRSGYGSVEESAEETARRRTRWFGEAGRRRIELQEERMRRDPVYAEKIARRHAAFPLPWTVASASTPSSVSAAVVPEHCYFDPKPAAATSTATVGASFLTGCTVRRGDLDLTAPSTCSSLCPGGDPSAPVASMVLGEKAVTTAGRASDSVYHVAQPVAMPTSVHVDLVDCAMIRAASSADITFGPRVRIPATTNPVASAVRESELGKQTSSTSSAVCPELVPNATAAVLTQDVINIVISSGSDVLASMSAQKDKPEDADSAGTHEDEQLLACSTVERPLAFVTVRDVASDHSFFTNMSVMPLTLSTFDVNDRIANKHEVFLPLKLLELSLSPSKELATTRSLLPWNPGEEAGLSRDSVLSSDSAQHASVTDFKDSYVRHQQLGELFWYLFDNASHFLISSATQQEFMDRYGVTAVVSRLLILVMRRNEVVLWPYFQSTASSLIQFLPWDPGQPWYGNGAKLSALEHGLVVMLAADSGLACLQENSVHELCSCSFEAGTILNLMVTLMALQPWPSSVLIPQPSWELFTLFLMLAREDRYTAWIWCYLDDMHSTLGRTNLSIPHSGMHIPSPEKWMLVYCHDARVQFQWDIAVQKDTSFGGFLAIFNGRAEIQRHYSYPGVLTDADHNGWNFCHIQRCNSHCSELIEWPLLQSEIGFHALEDILFLGCELEQCDIPWIDSLVALKSGFQYCRAGQYGRSGIVTLWDWSSWRYPPPHCLLSCFNEHMVLYDFEVIQGKIVWWLKLQHSYGGNQFAPLSYAEMVQASLPADCSQSYFTLNGDCRYLTSGIASTVTFQFLAYVAMLSSSSLEFYQRKFSWDPGICELCCLCGFFTQAEAERRRHAATPFYYRGHYLYHAGFFDKVGTDHDYYLHIFCDQVHIFHDYYIGVSLEKVRVVFYINFVKVCLDYYNLGEILTHQVPWDPGGLTQGLCLDHNTQLDLGNVLKRQVPWDPGGSTRYRLEVKPTFKDGGMLATLLPSLWAEPWAALIGPELLESHRKTASTNTQEGHTNRAAWNGTASASFATVSSSSSLVHLLLCNA